MMSARPKPFFARSFWRDYLLGGTLIASGFMLTGPTAPLHGFPGWCVGSIGVVILACACGWSIVRLFRRTGGG